MGGVTENVTSAIQPFYRIQDELNLALGSLSEMGSDAAMKILVKTDFSAYMKQRTEDGLGAKKK